MDAPLIAAFALLFALAGVAHVAGRGAVRAAPESTAPAERRSSVVLGLAHLVSLLAAATVPFIGLGPFPLGAVVGWLGVASMVAGLALQLWAMRTLGAFFTLTLRAAEAQPLVVQGPYRRVRHPGYLGQIIVWLGLALASRSAVVLLVVASALAVGYGYRIRAEERMLATTLGAAWERYAAGRARLVPGIL
jgi:protein-S-isoprenylcysteine O-methyltransferase